jgi:starch-binding outer membrane protein, SusD/RagB family
MTTITMRRVLASVALAVSAPSLHACGEGLLGVETPDVIDPSALDNPQGVSALHAGAVAEFTYALDNGGAGGPALALYSALFTDESMHASTPPAVREWDLRSVLSTNSVAPFLFLNLQRARARTENVAARIAGFLSGPDARVGELWALSGFTYILFAELYCSGVPISRAEPLEYGRPLTTAELLDTALVRLTTAAAAAAGDARILNLIAVLRGRALLNRAQFSQAATAVASVPTNFTYQVFHATTTPRQTNQIPALFSADIHSVTNGEGGNGLNYASANDPRVPTLSTGLSRNDGVTPMVRFTKYASQADPVIQASGVEARLIEAEAALQAPTNVTLFLSKLNEARATVSGLAPLTDPGTQSAREDLLFRERAFWFYLTAHRLGDLRRLLRAPYGRAAANVYPSGAYHKQGLTRGTQLSFVVPQPEENNPEYDASACNPAAP